MSRFRLAPEVKRMLFDICIVGLLYLLVEFARTEEQPVTDWLEWMKAAGFGALYRVTPELIQYMGVLRARLDPAAAVREPVIGQGFTHAVAADSDRSNP